jgi:hypothetical protein
MKICFCLLLLLGLATSVSAAVIWDESVNGELSTNPAAPTPITFAVGSNIINGNVGNVNAKTRDYITFTVPAAHTVTSLNLLVYDQDNLGFAALNAGTTSIIPSNPTINFWMSGIHVAQTDVSFDLMDLFVNRSVTTESLPESELGPGDYCFIIQQTSPLIVNYSLEWVMTGPVSTEASTWGSIKALYR